MTYCLIRAAVALTSGSVDCIHNEKLCFYNSNPEQALSMGVCQIRGDIIGWQSVHRCISLPNTELKGCVHVAGGV